MPNPRILLDWNRPALYSAAEKLLDCAPSGRKFDLSNLIVVLPGRSACRRLQELLAIKSSNKCIFPRIITVGALPELLYTPKQQFATPLTQAFAWAEALRGLSKDELQVIIPHPPADEDVPAWLNLGELLSGQHRQLAADRLNFEDVSKKGKSLAGFDEFRRWQVLAEVQNHYLKSLDDLGLWDQQTARLHAVDYKECTTDNPIVLIGTVDLNRTLIGMLEAVRDHLTVMIHAPEAFADRFDEFGRLISARWVDLEMEIEDAQITVVDGPQQQAERVALELSQSADRFSVDEITICVPDDRLVPTLRRTLSQVGVRTHWPIDQTVADSAPFQLLRAIADYHASQATSDFSNLIRHPDFTAWLNENMQRSDWLTDWDDYVGTHLQRHTRKVISQGRTAVPVRELVKLVQRILQPLSDKSRTLFEWFGPIDRLLLTVYGNREFDTEDPHDQRTLASIQAICSAWTDHEKLPEQLSPVLDAAEAIRLTLHQVAGDFLPAEKDAEAIELSGWLDLSLDDASLAIITTCNEGFVPASVNHDLFLPNRLRAHLGLEDNSQRYARDLYLLSTILASRQTVKLIAARRDLHNDPLTPSRLLFATSADRVAERVERFFSETAVQANIQFAQSAPFANRPGLTIPRPIRMPEPKRSFSVTEFRDYLASPYRYYLKYIERLEEVSDAVVELDPAGFGSLIHDVLQEFGRSKNRNVIDPARIATSLDASLDRLAKQQYGSDALFPIYVQIEQIRHRLHAFARWQANWASQGWQIRHSEVGYGRNVDFPLNDGTSIRLRGRIDRIDYHPQTGQWAILDYKTGDKGNSPDQTHRRNNEWLDLQLPLYRHLAEPLGVTGDVKLGYIILSRTIGEIGEKIAEWTTADLLAADEIVRQTAQKIINQEFWILQDRPPQWESEFAPICQDGVFGQEALV